MKLIHGIDDKRYDGRFRLFIRLLFAFTFALLAAFVGAFIYCLINWGPRSLYFYAPLAGVLIFAYLSKFVLWMLDSYRITAEGIMIRHAFSTEFIPWDDCKEIGVFAVAMVRNGNIHPYLFVFLSKEGGKDIKEERIDLNACFFLRSGVKCFRFTEERLEDFRSYHSEILRYDWNELHARWEPAAAGAELSDSKSPWPKMQESERLLREKKLRKRRQKNLP